MRTPTPSRKRIALGAGLTATALVMSGCVFPFGGLGSSDSSSSTTSSTPPTSSAPAEGALLGIDNARPAVVRIQAEGSYVDPVDGRVDSGWSGSGFIIDAEGHVVTNAHVVEGAGLLRVNVEGQSGTVTARVLGVSECNDLAVLDLSGDGYSYLAWHEGDVQPGADVYVAGFPLGDPEYSLTRGIISKAKADGDSDWASLPFALEHDAAIQPGNSGGPLLDSDARVVGVNYASSSPTNTSQFFAIPGTVAQDVVATLMTGEDVESLGLNGFAWYNPETDVGGIWVSGVRAGSAASNVGMEPGDILLSLAGREVVNASDNATKRGYCDVLRTQGDTSAMEITVYRGATGEFLEGEINNAAKPLTVTGTTAPDTPDDNGGTDDNGQASVPSGYRLVNDASGRLTTVAPTGWGETKTNIDTDWGKASVLEITTDSGNFLTGNWEAPGVMILMFKGGSKGELLTIRNVLATSVGFPDRCIDQGGEKAPKLDTSMSGDQYYDVYKYYTHCTATKDTSGYLNVRYYPDQDVSVVLLAVDNNDKQYDIVDNIYRYIDVK
ncbi:MAG: S1C family serine protease [Candidatus Nanopelagicales bacterium]|jgi:serine protease Do